MGNSIVRSKSPTLFGLLAPVVSSARGKPEPVGAQTRRLVNKAIEALSVRPVPVTAKSSKKPSLTIGVVIGSFGSPYYGSMLDGVENVLQTVGYKTIAESSRGTPEGERAAFTSLFARQCDSVIIHSNRLRDEELSTLFDQQPNAVLMNRLLPNHRDRCVYFDNFLGGALAAQHLLSMGHRNVAMIRGPAKYRNVAERTRGFAETFADAGLVMGADLVAVGDYEDQSGFAAMTSLIETGKQISAVFCHNDQMAAGAINACRFHGIAVPDEVSIIGIDDCSVARHTSPKLTTIRQPLTAISEAAGRLAHCLATGDRENPSLQRFFEARVVERDSVADISAHLAKSIGYVKLAPKVTSTA